MAKKKSTPIAAKTASKSLPTEKKSQPVKPKTVTVVGKTFVAKTRIRRLPRPGVAPSPQ